jgi:hypothetical protein
MTSLLRRGFNAGALHGAYRIEPLCGRRAGGAPKPLPQYRKTTVGPLSVKKCPHCLLAANLIYILAASKRQQLTIKLYCRVMILAA